MFTDPLATFLFRCSFLSSYLWTLRLSAASICFCVYIVSSLSLSLSLFIFPLALSVLSSFSTPPTIPFGRLFLLLLFRFLSIFFLFFSLYSLSPLTHCSIPVLMCCRASRPSQNWRKTEPRTFSCGSAVRGSHRGVREDNMLECWAQKCRYDCLFAFLVFVFVHRSSFIARRVLSVSTVSLSFHILFFFLSFSTSPLSFSVGFFSLSLSLPCCSSSLSLDNSLFVAPLESFS